MGDDVALGEYEKLLLATKTTARKELVLLHPERYVASGFTRRWLKVRQQVSFSTRAYTIRRIDPTFLITIMLNSPE